MSTSRPAGGSAPVGLDQLLAALETAGVSFGRADGLPGPAAVTAVEHDSRRVVPGAVFVARPGLRADGADFIRDALDRGAIAVVTERPGDDRGTAPLVTVSDTRLALAILADAYHGHPSHELMVVGITGTNGKTTTAYLVEAILEAAGWKPGRLGTVTYRTRDCEREAARTTPEAPELQATLRKMVESGCRSCVMEVSSHGLTQRRVDGVRFAAGVFTNLTRDHLEYHGDMEAYFSAKRRLFDMLPDAAPAVVNVDDPNGRRLVEIVHHPVTYGIDRPADVTPGPLSLSWEGTEFDAKTPDGIVHIHSRLGGRSNVYNALAAVAAAGALGVSPADITTGIAALQGVPGRFQIVSTEEDDIVALVDYAHTDDALRRVLEAARALAEGRVITVFGCGGERDRTKRPLMGAVAARLSDVVIVTSDNPRAEDPQQIIDDILSGVSPGTERQVIEDRKDAIEQAMAMARPADLVLVAGRGHERYQTVGDQTVPFEDSEVVRGALARRRSRRRAG